MIVARSNRRAEGFEAAAVAGNCGRGHPHRYPEQRRAHQNGSHQIDPTGHSQRDRHQAHRNQHCPNTAKIRHTVDFPSESTTGNMRMSPCA